MKKLIHTKMDTIHHCKIEKENGPNYPSYKNSETATGDREKNWPTAKWRVLSYDPRNNFDVPVPFSFLT